MNRKQIIIATTLGLSVLSGSALADFALYNDSNHFYIGSSVEAYHFGTPDLNIGSTSKTSSKNLTSEKTSGTTIMPSLTVGFHFNNGFIPSFFGQKANIELSGGFASFDNSTKNSNLGNGYVRFINGADATNIVSGNSVTIRDFHAKTDSTYQNINLTFRGDRGSQNEMVTQHPEIGLVYTHLSQDNSYGLKYGDNNFINSETTLNTKENIDTDYYGVAMGDTFKFQLSRHFFSNVGAKLQLLHASAKFDGSENHNYVNPPFSNSGSEKASDTLSQFTYRTILSAGMSYAFTVKPDSPSIGVDVGYDRLGFTPTVTNPTGSNTKAAHLTAEGSNNFFGGVNFHLPL